MEDNRTIEVVRKLNAAVRGACNNSVLEIDQDPLHSIQLDVEKYDTRCDSVDISGGNFPYLRYALVREAVSRGDISYTYTCAENTKYSESKQRMLQ